MDEKLTKAEIGFLSKLLAAISVESFRQLLTKHILNAFITSHNNTNVEFNFNKSKPDPNIVDYIKEREIILSDKTASKLEGDLKYELITALQNNESISQITKRLDGIFNDMMPWQLERIARSEVIDAQNAGRISAYKANDVVEYKMWVAAKGGKGARVCDLCASLHGQVQPIDKPFVNPNNPSESWQHPICHPNGRCTTVPLTDKPDSMITINGLIYDSDEKIGKIEIPMNSLKARNGKAWVVRYANGMAVQCFEDEVDADYFIETSKKVDAKWFDFGNKIYRDVKPKWQINRKGTKITFDASDEPKKTGKIEIDKESLNKGEKRIWIKETSKRKGHYRKIKNAKPKEPEPQIKETVTQPKEEVSKGPVSMTQENLKELKSFEDLGMMGGVHEPGSYRAKFEDGANAMYKVMTEGSIVGEVSTYDISEMLNWNVVPETIRTNFDKKGDGSCQRWVEGGQCPHEGHGDGLGTMIGEEHFGDLSEILVLDMVTGNYDRHGGNVMIDENDQCWAIDNEDWGTAGAADDFMTALDNCAGVSDVGGFSPMTRWLDKNLGRKDYLKFREKVVENMGHVVANKDEIINYYNKYEGSDISVGDDADEKSMTLILLCIKENLDYIEKYYGKNK